MPENCVSNRVPIPIPDVYQLMTYLNGGGIVRDGEERVDRAADSSRMRIPRTSISRTFFGRVFVRIGSQFSVPISYHSSICRRVVLQSIVLLHLLQNIRDVVALTIASHCLVVAGARIPGRR